jgi:hypothetical protein
MAKAKSRSFQELVRKRWRAWLRAVHRDFGYLAVGLTMVYAISGIAINHIGEWDPNFKSVVDTSEVDGPYPEDEEALVQKIVEHMSKHGGGVDPDDVRAAFYDSDTVFELSLENSVARLDTATGKLSVASKEPRFFLRVANWLHYNRGKSEWTYIADGYAIMLLYLAASGMFMLKGKKGLVGRGGILIFIGAAVPLAYVQLAAGP